MSLTAISSLESARRKLFMNQTYKLSRKLAVERFCSQEAEMSLTAYQHARIGEKKIFRETRRTYCLEIGNQTFLC